MTLSSASFDLLEQLVERLLGHNIDHATITRVSLQSAASLAKFKAMSTDEHHIEVRWQSLCDKFNIKGHDELAENLRKCKMIFLDPKRELVTDAAATQQRILKYDMLSLLLALSKNPTKKQMFTSTASLDQVSSTEFWKETLAEEPMEGDHWLEWENLSEDSQESYDFDLDHDRLSRYQRRNHQQLHDTIADSIWDDKAAVMQQIQLGNTEVKNLSSRQYWKQKDEEISLSDGDLMREVLFLLQGHPGVIFKRTEDGDSYFELDMNNIQKEQATSTSLYSSLWEFCVHGNTITSLRLWTARCLASDVKTYGQTCQAFAISVASFLRSLDKHTADIQVNLCRAGDMRVVSLLQLKSTLRLLLECAKTTHDALFSALGAGTYNPRDNAMRLLKSLTVLIGENQAAGKMEICQHLLRIYKDTLVPISRMIDDWVMYGSLDADVANEFFISRCEEIPDNSPDFWSDGFKLHENESTSIIFDTQFLHKIFAAGKAIHIISHFEHYTCLPSKPSLPFLQHLLRRMTLLSNTDDQTLAPQTPTTQAHNGTTTLMQQMLFPAHHASSVKHRQIQPPSSLSTHRPMETYLFSQDIAEAGDAYISVPYQESSLKLKMVLESKCQLSRHLQCLSSIYLMLHGRAMHTFCELLFQRMDQHKIPVDPMHLNKLFKEACAVSGQSRDFDTAYVTIDMQLDDIDYTGRLTFQYELPWPVNCFIKQSSLAEYSKVTTLLLRLKHAKHVLERHMLFGTENNMRLYALRMKLMWFVNTFWGYVMTTVLHAETNALEEAVKQTEDMDRIAALHTIYVSKIVDRCLLGEKTRSILKAIFDILNIVHNLARLYADERDAPDVQILEKDFRRSNEFIGTTLEIIARKGGFPWFDALASSLSV